MAEKEYEFEEREEEEIKIELEEDFEMLSNMMMAERQLSIRFPGFKFSPTDEELISYYLKKKIEGCDSLVQVIPELDLCQMEPWDLPEKSVIQSNSEWFFFSARGRKYPNGMQSKRGTECGYWKATGKERNVKSGSNVIGTKRTLVFHKGRAPRGERTEWIMHEYRMIANSQDSRVVCRVRKNSEFRLDETPKTSCHNQSVDNSIGEDDEDLTRIFDGENAIDDFNTSSYSPIIEPNDTGSNDRGDKALDGFNTSNISPAIEPNDTQSEDQNMTNDDQNMANDNQTISNDDQLQSYSFASHEDDCFNDIMNDDIVKLEECFEPSSLDEDGARIKLRQVKPKEWLGPVPTQGAASRRIRLGKARSNLIWLESTQGLGVTSEDDSVHQQNGVVKWQLMVMILVALSLLVLCFFFFCMG